MATASAVGLAVDNAVVLNDSNRLVVRLMPCDVVARVVPLGYRVFAAALGAEREVQVLRRLADFDAPLAALEPRVEPRVSVRDGFEIELLTYYEPVPTRALPPKDCTERAQEAALCSAPSGCRDAALYGSGRRCSAMGRTSRRHT